MNFKVVLVTMHTAIMICCVFTQMARADDWSQWLGPHRDGIWRESGIVERFPEGGPPLRWKKKIGGGYTGPAVADGRVFLMDRQSDVKPEELLVLPEGSPASKRSFYRRLLPGKERVLCLRETDGTELWSHSYDCPYTSVAAYAIGPRCTPTVDGDRVYTLGAEGNLLCLRVGDGSIVWSRDFKKDYDLVIPLWGVAAHPLIDHDRLICVVGGKNSTCVAFDKHTGRELWRSMNAPQPGYCAPIIYEFGGLRQIIIWHGGAVNGLNPENGEVYWSVPFKTQTAMSIGAPQKEGNSLFLMGFNRRSARIEVAESGRSAEIVWEGNPKRGIDGVMNTAVLLDGHIYGCGYQGRYICARLDTGERLWSTYKPSTGKRPRHWANVFTIRHKDRFFHANDLGDLIIAKMSPAGYEEVDRAHLIDPTHQVVNRTVVWSHPAFANRSVYLRNDQELRCYSLSRSH
jgi:hypothetical protein